MSSLLSFPEHSILNQKYSHHRKTTVSNGAAKFKNNRKVSLTVKHLRLLYVRFLIEVSQLPVYECRFYSSRVMGPDAPI